MRTVSLLVIVGGFLLVGCAEPATSVKNLEEADVFQSNISVGMTRLRAQFSKLQPESVERDAKCRELIFDLLGMCEDDDQSQALADAFAAVIARSDSFNMYDRNVLWLAGDLLEDYPPADAAFLVALGRKVENARSDDTPQIYQMTYSSLAVGFILNRISYDGQVNTYNDRVDDEQWALLHAWLEANGDILTYDPETGLYLPMEPPPAEAEPELPEDSESPADDEPEEDKQPPETPEDTEPLANPEPPGPDEMVIEFE